MHFQSENDEELITRLGVGRETPFFDCEVFPTSSFSTGRSREVTRKLSE